MSSNSARPSPALLDSEDAFLRRIDRFFPNTHKQMLLGRGDDCCLLATPGSLLLSTDLFLEDRHFRRAYFSPADIGWKALAVNLSDIAAMGGRPLGFSLGLMAPAGLDAAFWDGLFEGMAALASQWDLPLTGGDLSRADALGLAITIWGEPGPSGRILRRGGCAVGERIFVADGGRPDAPLRLGLARVGFLALEEHGPAAAAQYPEAVYAHLRPQPLLDAGLALAARDAVSGLLDVSDGLARDIPRLVGSSLENGAHLNIAFDGLHPELLAYAARRGLNPVALAVLGGEDYALCGTMLETMSGGEDSSGLRVIGRVTQEPGLFVNGARFEPRGFDHFAPVE